MKRLDATFRYLSRDSKALEAAAARWLSLKDRGLSPEQESEWIRWLCADVRHARIYNEMEKTWSLLDETVGPISSAALEWELDALPLRPRRLLWLSLSFAAAAALAVVFAGSWRHARPSEAENDFACTAATDRDAVKAIALPDGSRVELNIDSSVEVHFTASERSVRLIRGEAEFAVARNPARPFIVTAGTIAVRAVGTAFDVRLKSGAIEVIVTEGKVRVDAVGGGNHRDDGQPASPPVHLVSTLSAGERLLIPTANGKSTLPVVAHIVPAQKSEQEFAWQQQELKFTVAPLADIVAEFNRGNRAKIEIADSALAERRFGGNFNAGDPVTFIHVLERTFGVVAERRGDKIVLHKGR
jgi:transmembrane sensor